MFTIIKTPWYLQGIWMPHVPEVLASGSPWSVRHWGRWRDVQVQYGRLVLSTAEFGRFWWLTLTGRCGALQNMRETFGKTSLHKLKATYPQDITKCSNICSNKILGNRLIICIQYNIMIHYIFLNDTTIDQLFQTILDI